MLRVSRLNRRKILQYRQRLSDRAARKFMQKLRNQRRQQILRTRRNEPFSFTECGALPTILSFLNDIDVLRLDTVSRKWSNKVRNHRNYRLRRVVSLRTCGAGLVSRAQNLLVSAWTWSLARMYSNVETLQLIQSRHQEPLLANPLCPYFPNGSRLHLYCERGELDCADFYKLAKLHEVHLHGKALVVSNVDNRIRTLYVNCYTKLVGQRHIRSLRMLIVRKGSINVRNCVNLSVLVLQDMESLTTLKRGSFEFVKTLVLPHKGNLRLHNMPNLQTIHITHVRKDLGAFVRSLPENVMRLVVYGSWTVPEGWMLQNVQPDRIDVSDLYNCPLGVLNGVTSPRVYTRPQWLAQQIPCLKI